MKSIRVFSACFTVLALLSSACASREPSAIELRLVNESGIPLRVSPGDDSNVAYTSSPNESTVTIVIRGLDAGSGVEDSGSAPDADNSWIIPGESGEQRVGYDVTFGLSPDSGQVYFLSAE